MSKVFYFADLFCGCGGLSYGFARSSRFKGILATDCWDQAGQTYIYNHPNVPFFLSNLDDEENVLRVVEALKGCDVLIGGPPCQGFSTLGKREINCSKSALVDVFASIASRVSPKIILMENVKGFLSKRHPGYGTYIESIERILGSNIFGYNIWNSVINFYEYGLAQTRNRYIMIAVRRDVDIHGSVLEEIIHRLDLAKKQERKVLRDVIADLPDVKSGQGQPEMVSLNNGSGGMIYNHQSLKHSPELQERLRHVPTGGGLLDVPRALLTPHLLRMVNGEYGSGGHVKNIYGRLEWGKPCGTIVAGMDKITCGRYVHPDQDRLLTPRECARIQGYPDDFRFFGGIVAQYRQIGNSVPPTMSTIFADVIASGLDAICVPSESI